MWLALAVDFVNLIAVTVVEGAVKIVTGVSMLPPAWPFLAWFAVTCLISIVLTTFVLANLDPLKVRAPAYRLFALPATRRRVELARVRGAVDIYPTNVLNELAKASYYVMRGVVVFADVLVVVLLTKYRLSRLGVGDVGLVLLLITILGLGKSVFGRGRTVVGQRRRSR
jgi:hypothetical protein